MEYLNNLSYIILKEDEIKSYIDKLETIKDEIYKLEDGNNFEDLYKNKLNDINYNIEKLKSYITNYHENIIKLDNDQRTLYNNIKSKYVNITDDEIKEQVINYIKDVDIEFKRKNTELYNKLKNRKNE
ncbi:MAG: hypothetical protein WDA02_03200 [Saccharofermentanales bacterium]